MLNKLKKLYASIVVSFLLLLSSCSVVAANDEIIQRCTSQATIAANIMEARQNGAAIVRIFEVNKQFPEVKPLLDFFTTEAYKQPLYSSDTAKQQAIVEFSNTIFMTCMQHFDKVS